MQMLHPIEDAELCPMSEATIFLAAPSKFNQKQIYIYIQPTKSPSSFALAHSLGICDSNKIPCKIINFTQQPIFLRKTCLITEACVLP